MKNALLAMCLSVCVLIPARADFTVKEYQTVMRGGKQDVIQAFEGVVSGIGAGIMAANAYALLTKKISLFCSPDGLALNGYNYIDILNRTIKQLQEAPGQARESASRLDEVPLSTILIQGLADTFPCPAK